MSSLSIGLRRVYPLPIPDGYGLPDLGVGYPREQALYPIPVRRIQYLPSASFGSRLAADTLAFGYKIPSITALQGLGAAPPRTH